MRLAKKEMPRVRFFGKTTGFSGYSYATKCIAKSFASSRIPTYFASKDIFFKGMSTCNPRCDVDFYIHTPPFSRHKSSNYKIGYFYWETDKLPLAWGRDICTSLNEIWVPCNLVEKACRAAGFKGKIEVLHTPYLYNSAASKVKVPAIGSVKSFLDSNVYIFYSIFQWNIRKGYKDLISSYLDEFSEKDNTCLIIKTNPIKHKLHGLSKVNKDILEIKNKFKSKKLPPIFLITENLSEDQILGLHKLGDCFVLPHKGEGWGMPIHDAMNSGNLIITTKFGGITEFLDSSNSMIINHAIESVTPMTWNPYYEPSQRWARPSQTHLKSLMRSAYNREYEKLITHRSKKLGKSLNTKLFGITAEEILLRRRAQGVF